jgi:DNA-directed RNA polymerase specialized sigma24 family protein
MADARSAAQEARDLIDRCLAAVPEAIDEFQQRYGPLIYSYPMRVYRMPAEDAGDFYVFALEKGRIFRRTQTYAGRTSLRSYLAGFVLDNLVLEWKRGMHEVDTVSIDGLEELPDLRSATADAAAQPSLAEILAGVEASKAVLLKLLFIEDCDLQTVDLRRLSEMSGRRLPDLLAAIDQLRERVREREVRQKHEEDALDGVQAWIALYERRLRQTADELMHLPPSSAVAARVRAERAELERKVRRRQQQRATLIARTQRRKVTAPYKDIAALLNTTVGNVASLISRARKELANNATLRDRLAVLGDQND